MFNVENKGAERLDIEFSGKLDSEIESALIPGLEIKAFEVGKETDAEAWLAN